jgi:hypothetical protein
MPKKGLRKIVVDGREYNYVIKPLLYGGSNSGRVTVECDGKYYSETIIDSITPSMVEQMIRREFLNG